jgi:hypothetical protein
MTDTRDPLAEALRALAPAPGSDEVTAALRSVTRRAQRRRQAVAVTGTLAAAVTALGGAAVLSDPGDPPATTAGPSTRPPDDEWWPWQRTDEGAVEPSSDALPPEVDDDAIARFEELEAELNAYRDANPDGAWNIGGMTYDVDGRLLPVVGLRAYQEEVAAEVHERWGDDVVVYVGARQYPSGEPLRPEEMGQVALRPCLPLWLDDSVAGLAADVDLADGGRVPSGEDLAGTVTVTNTGEGTVGLHAHERLEGVVVERGTDRVVGLATGFDAPPWEVVDLAPGESTEVELVAGTTSCGPEGPPGLAPGDYEVVLGISGAEVPPPALGQTVVFGPAAVIGRAPLTVTE